MLKILSFILCIDYIFILCLSQVKKSGFHPSRKHVGFSPQIYNLAENKVRSIKIIPEEESLATGYMDYLHRQKKDNMF